MSFEVCCAQGRRVMNFVSRVSLEWVMMLKWLKLKDVTVSSE